MTADIGRVMNENMTLEELGKQIEGLDGVAQRSVGHGTGPAPPGESAPPVHQRGVEGVKLVAERAEEDRVELPARKPAKLVAEGGGVLVGQERRANCDLVFQQGGAEECHYVQV